MNDWQKSGSAYREAAMSDEGWADVDKELLTNCNFVVESTPWGSNGRVEP
jgi:hypothetical protein